MTVISAQPALGSWFILSHDMGQLWAGTGNLLALIRRSERADLVAADTFASEIHMLRHGNRTTGQNFHKRQTMFGDHPVVLTAASSWR